LRMEAGSKSVNQRQLNGRSARRSFSFRTIRFAACLLIFLSALPYSFAKIHPVPLEKNADSATCLQCHEERSKGKFVHTAVQTGCLSCHEVRVNRDVTRVTLTTAVPYKLCLGCHADKDATQTKGRIHPPSARDCLTCHDPHSSDNKYQLLKATSGDKDENLCLGCHKQGVDVPEKGSRHAALDMGCETCHTIHKSGVDLTEENKFHLTKSAPALCLDCHDAGDENLQKAHHNQPFASVDCLQCHDAHQSAQPRLMAKFLHPPFADKNCEVCHAPAQDGKVVLTEKDAKSLCVTCHDEQAKQIDSAKVQHPGAMGDCIDCHSPHASSQPGLPKTDAVSICLGCHTDIAEAGQKAYLHQPVFSQGCYTCHEAHGNGNLHLLRAANPNPLCLECHGPDAKPQKVEGEPLVAIFNGKVELPQNYFAKVPVLPIKYGLGHPVARHPVVDQMDPAHPDKVLVTLNCATCHQPHSSSKPDLLVKDQEPNTAFCASCHKKVGSQP
jgi:predicted CXXCH cytochrome family protein